MTPRPRADAADKLRDVDLSVDVGDVDAAYAEALARGLDVVYPITTEPWGPRRFFVRLPGGTVVNVVGHARALNAQRTARTSTRCTYGAAPPCGERAGEPVVGPDQQRVVARRQPVHGVVREERLQRGLAVGAVERGTVRPVRPGHHAVEPGLRDADGAERVARRW